MPNGEPVKKKWSPTFVSSLSFADFPIQVHVDTTKKHNKTILNNNNFIISILGTSVLKWSETKTRPGSGKNEESNGIASWLDNKYLESTKNMSHIVCRNLILRCKCPEKGDQLIKKRNCISFKKLVSGICMWQSTYASKDEQIKDEIFFWLHCPWAG